MNPSRNGAAAEDAAAGHNAERCIATCGGETTELWFYP